MNRDRLHALVKAAAHNAYGMRKEAEARKAYAKAVVKTAAVRALRKQDLKGAILARMNNEKIAAGGKLWGAIAKAIAKGGNRVGSKLSRLGKTIGSFGDDLARLGIKQTSRNLGNALGSKVRSIPGRAVNFGRTLTGKNLSRFVEQLGMKPGSPEAKAFLQRARQHGGYGKGVSRADLSKMMAEDTKGIENYIKNIGTVGTESMSGAQRIAKQMQADMWRARRNAAIAAGGGALGLGYMHNPGADYDPYRY